MPETQVRVACACPGAAESRKANALKPAAYLFILDLPCDDALSAADSGCRLAIAASGGLWGQVT
jgi:hypothetical protein